MKAPSLPREFYELIGLLESTVHVTRYYLSDPGHSSEKDHEKTAAGLSKFAGIKAGLLDAEAYLTLSLIPNLKSPLLNDKQIGQLWLDFGKKVRRLIEHLNQVIKDTPVGFTWSLDLHLRILQEAGCSLSHALMLTQDPPSSWPSSSSASSSSSSPRDLGKFPTTASIVAVKYGPKKSSQSSSR